jgi:hypothetical protein
MSAEVIPVRFVSRAALMLGAALSAAAPGCEHSAERVAPPPATPATPATEPARVAETGSASGEDAHGLATAADATTPVSALMQSLLGTTLTDGGAHGERVHGTRPAHPSLGLDHPSLAGGYGGPPVQGTIGVPNSPGTHALGNGPATTRYGAPPCFDDWA